MTFGYSGDKDDEEQPGFWNPERRLLLAVMRRAVSDFTGMHTTLAKEAEEWIFGTPLAPPFGVFTFSWVCEQLDFHPVRLAQGISGLPRESGLGLPTEALEKLLRDAQVPPEPA